MLKIGIYNKDSNGENTQHQYKLTTDDIHFKTVCLSKLCIAYTSRLNFLVVDFP